MDKKKIGRLTIPFTQLLPSLRLGNISFNIGQEQFDIIVPLKGNVQIGFIASGYRLVKDGIELASTEFPARGSKDSFRIGWGEKLITFSMNGRKNDIYINGALLGSISSDFGREKVAAVDVGEKLPVEIQVFTYFAYKKYSELSSGNPGSQ